ncbi:MAG: hypothetical protein RBR78_01055 [Flavobacteriaceae bacterium]|jgi:hypothetical protein|nr:hypothetical protein [Flavobacteriaceae bacterium]
MISNSRKAKQFLLFLAKILVVGLAFWFIYKKLSGTKWLNPEDFTNIIAEKFTVSSILIILFLSFLNRFLEILKWQNLADTIRKTSLYQATRQVLSALVFALFTPNGLGEYGAKAFFFPKSEAKNIVFLNFVCNGIQMIITVTFGLLGLLLLGYYDWFLVVLAVSVLFFLFSFFLKEFTIKGFSISKLIEKINNIPKTVHQKNTVLGLGRYLSFSHQQYYLFWLLGVDLAYLPFIATIMAVYFLASCLPNFQFLDFIVKGGVAVYFFGIIGVNEWIVMFVTLLMWLLNVVLPVVFGSIFVLLDSPKFLIKEKLKTAHGNN